MGGRIGQLHCAIPMVAGKGLGEAGHAGQCQLGGVVGYGYAAAGDCLRRFQRDCDRMGIRIINACMRGLVGSGRLLRRSLGSLQAACCYGLSQGLHRLCGCPACELLRNLTAVCRRPAVAGHGVPAEQAAYGPYAVLEGTQLVHQLAVLGVPDQQVHPVGLLGELAPVEVRSVKVEGIEIGGIRLPSKIAHQAYVRSLEVDKASIVGHDGVKIYVTHVVHYKEHIHKRLVIGIILGSIIGNTHQLIVLQAAAPVEVANPTAGGGVHQHDIRPVDCQEVAAARGCRQIHIADVAGTAHQGSLKGLRIHGVEIGGQAGGIQGSGVELAVAAIGHGCKRLVCRGLGQLGVLGQAPGVEGAPPDLAILIPHRGVQLSVQLGDLHRTACELGSVQHRGSRNGGGAFGHAGHLTSRVNRGDGRIFADPCDVAATHRPGPYRGSQLHRIVRQGPELSPVQLHHGHLVRGGKAGAVLLGTDVQASGGEGQRAY